MNNYNNFKINIKKYSRLLFQKKIHFFLLTVLILFTSYFCLSLIKIKKLENQLSSKIQVNEHYKNKIIQYNFFLKSSKFTLEESEEENISFMDQNIFVNSFELPFMENKIFSKPVAYLEKNTENVFIVSGDGVISYFNRNQIGKKEKLLKIIQSNLNIFFRNDLLFKPGKISIRDVLIKKNEIYLSIIDEIENNCWNTSILKSKINYDYLNFDYYFRPDDCSDFNEKIHHNKNSSGGRIVDNLNSLFFSVGDYLDYPKSQNNSSTLGKILKINENGSNFEIISKGHRNPQGLYLDTETKILISTEHGPKGGDEINVINLVESSESNNFGWPISSYGEHYKTKVDTAPLFKSHAKYGFKEPVFYFEKSIGISELIQVPNKFLKSKNKLFFVTALGHKNQIHEGDRSIHLFEFSNDYKDLISVEIQPLWERIRDIIYLDEENIFLVLLENRSKNS